MKISHMILVAVTAFALPLGIAAAADDGQGISPGAPDQKTAVKTAQPAAPIAEMKGDLCPVMGLPINKKYSYDYKGTRYYFCCSSCVAEFMAHPEKYIKKIDK